MVAGLKIQRRRKSKGGGRWTPESVKSLYDLRNRYSHLSWKEFHQRNFFPRRSFYSLVKAYSSYKQELAAEQRAKKMQSAASTSRPGLRTPSSRVLKRPAQTERDPRLGKPKQARLNAPSTLNNSTSLGSTQVFQRPSPVSSSDTDSDNDNGNISPSGRAEPFSKATPQTQMNKNQNASLRTVSKGGSPRAAPKTAERLEQQTCSGPQRPHNITTLYGLNKQPGAGVSNLPASAQGRGSTPETRQPSQEETIPAALQNVDRKQFLEMARCLAEDNEKWETKCQGYEATLGTLQSMYNTLQTQHKTLQTQHKTLEKDCDESRELHQRVNSHQKIEIEQLHTAKKRLSDEVDRLRDKSCRDCFKMRETLTTKDDELTKTKDELTNTKDELTNTMDELAITKDELAVTREELAKKSELISGVEKLFKGVPPSTHLTTS